MALTQHEDGSLTNEKGQLVQTAEGEIVTPEVEKTALQKAMAEIDELKAKLAGGKKPKADAPPAE